MKEQSIFIEKIILKKECAKTVKNFYDPFAHFYILPIVQKAHVAPLLLINEMIALQKHIAYVSYNNTRQLEANHYTFQVLDAFILQLHLIRQKKNCLEVWKAIQQTFKLPIDKSLSKIEFESYLLAVIPMNWQELETYSYENDCVQLKLIKNKS